MTPHPGTLLIIKTGAAGDVVRTTPLLSLYPGTRISWFVAPVNASLLTGLPLAAVYTRAEEIPERMTADLLISLDDDEALIRSVFGRVHARRIVGAYPAAGGGLTYTPDAAPWFDMGLLSRFGLPQANVLKLANRRSYQDILFAMLGGRFQGEPYRLPHPLPPSPLRGDIAVAPSAGARWPNKSWLHYDALIAELRAHWSVNVLPGRASLPEHIADVGSHRLLITNDSLPMHLALGLRIPCVALFTCTSPWEIFDYGLLRKVVSPFLEEFFFSRSFDERAAGGCPMAEVRAAVSDLLSADRGRRAGLDRVV